MQLTLTNVFAYMQNTHNWNSLYRFEADGKQVWAKTKTINKGYGVQMIGEKVVQLRTMIQS